MEYEDKPQIVPTYLDGMTREELLEAKQRNAEQMDSIRGQLDSATAEFHLSGTRADPAWFVGLTRKLRQMGRGDQEIARRLADTRAVRRDKAEADAATKTATGSPGITLPVAFVNVAEAQLDPATFQSIMAEARDEVGRSKLLSPST